MTSIDSPQFNPNSALVNLAGTEATTVVKKQKAIGKRQNELPPLGDSKGPDTVAYSRPNPLQPHALNFLVDPSTTDALSADITSLLVLLTKTQIENRSSQRKQWLLQAQNVLQTAASVAEEKKKAAALKFASETVNNSIDIAQNIDSAAESFSSAGESLSGGADIKTEANAKFGSDEELAPSKEGGLEGESGLSREESLAGEGSFSGAGELGEGVGSSKGAAGTKTSSNTEAKIKEEAKPNASSETQGAQEPEKAPESKALADSKSGKTETEAEKKTRSNAEHRAKKTEEEKEYLRTRKAEFIATKEANLNSRLDRKYKAISGITGAVAGIGKELGSALSYSSELASANAEQLKGLEDYQNSLASEQLDYANQLRDNAQKLLETLKSIEQARHQAVSAIVNI